MDGLQMQSRPASNTSLHSNYKAHGRPGHHSAYRPTPQRRPLRCVNEHAAHLRSPGPLESMLKTTTETGDIGIFSIKPRSSPSAAMYNQPSRRTYFGDSGRLPAPCLGGYEDDFLYHDFKRLRSNRDTTSEILSLYGSESQHTMPTSVSPSIDDGQRSYSLTTSSSRHAPLHKSFGMLQSQTHSGGFQRPRSPFPYPTRLKRPGVRPASPALGENGYIDYSRMVELERFSQRTVHGSYKAMYTQGHRRPPPLSLRADANRSTASLPSRASPSLYYHGTPHYRARTPNSLASWTSRPSERHQRGGSIDQSTRSASLTSIVEMYNRPATSNASTQPLHSTGSFYYDYSEEFENQPSQDVGPEDPICPIPKRAGRISRPMVLREDSSIGLEVVENDPDVEKANHMQREQGSRFASDKDETARNHTTCRNLPFSDPSDLVAVSNLGQSNQDSSSSAPQPQRRRTNRSVSPVDKRTSLEILSRGPTNDTRVTVLQELSPNRMSWRFCGPSKDGRDPKSDKQARKLSQSSLSKLRCSFDPAVSDFASILSSFDRVGKSPSPKAETEALLKGERQRESRRYENHDENLDSHRRLSKRLSMPTFLETFQEDQIYQKGHRRNIAALRISTTVVSPVESIEALRDSGKDLPPILSPEPISPVRQLRVKDSIPRLMKALPPLPKGVESLCRQSLESLSLSGEFDDVLQPIFGDSVMEKQDLDSEVKVFPSPAKRSRTSNDSPPKFKIRAKTSLLAVPLGDGNSEDPSVAEKSNYQSTQILKASPAPKPRLKLKVSRSQLGQTRLSHGVSNLPRNRLKQCNSLAELTSYSRYQGPERKHARASPIKQQKSPPRVSHDRKIEEEEVEEEVEEKGEEAKHPGSSPPHSDQFNISYPPLPHVIDDSPHVLKKERFSEVTSVSLDDCPNGRHRLRSKISMLRLRFVRAQSSIQSDATSAGHSPNKHKSVDVTPAPPTESEGNTSMATDENRLGRMRQELHGWKLKKWARDAKQAVRSYVKKSLDR